MRDSTQSYGRLLKKFEGEEINALGCKCDRNRGNAAEMLEPANFVSQLRSLVKNFNLMRIEILWPTHLAPGAMSISVTLIDP